jgi:hypothetical protein
MIFNITIGTAYFNQGFVNIQKRYSEYFGLNNALILVYLGSWDEVPFEARINRTAQPSGSPRIMMGNLYTTWVHQNHRLGDNLICEILNPNCTNSILIR